MIELIFFVSLAILVSFYCSLMEAAFLSITPAYVHLYETRHKKAGRRLARLKTEADRPLAAILSLNTIAHTLGATGAGAQAAILFGNTWIGIFSALFTLAILIFSEVIPKTLGTLHWRRLTGFVAQSLPILILVMLPLVWLSELVGRLLRHDNPKLVGRDEIQAFAELGVKEGALSNDEAEFIKSMLKFRYVKVESVMTPLSVVAAVDQSESIRDVLDQDIPFSRIPVYSDKPGVIDGYILKDDLHDASLSGTNHDTVQSFVRPIIEISVQTPLPRVITRFSEDHGHIAAVVNVDGTAAGIVTLEDAVETLLGWEIVDEFDPVVDMRELADAQP